MKNLKEKGRQLKGLILVFALIFAVEPPYLGNLITQVYADTAPILDPLSSPIPTIPFAGSTETTTCTTTTTQSSGETFSNQGPLSPCTGEPHSEDPEPIHDEHHAVFELVAYENVTHKVRAGCVDCQWSDANTWENGEVPTDGANVLISQDSKVVLDFVNTTSLNTVRIDGILEFGHDENTGLKVDTMVVSTTGTLIMGTEEHPVEAGVQAKIIIADRGAIDINKDPLQLGRGLISHGTVRMHGAEITEYLTLAHAPRRGDTELVLSNVPVNWKAGDRLILTSTDTYAKTNEELEILSISENRVKIRTLLYDHVIPIAGLSAYVTNVSRNVVIESETVRDISRRGHVMFMHSPKVEIANAGFYGLGRTDKRVAVDDPLLDEAGKVVPGTGDNARGRYSVHFHRTGVDPTKPPAVVKGSVVVDSPGLGFVNHASNVIFEKNVAFDVIGSAFFTEVGNEIGAFRNNLALYSRGSGEGVDSRSPLLQDFGHGGHGFWLQGPGVEVENNVVIGALDAAYVFFTRGLNEEGIGVAGFLAANLSDPSLARGQTTVGVSSVPLRKFKGNIAIAAKDGVETWFHLQSGGIGGGRSVIEDFTGWNLRASGIFNPYTANTIIRGGRLIGNVASPYRGAIGGNGVTKNMVYENLYVEGWGTGINVPIMGSTVIRGGYFNNINNILISTAMDANRTVDITGDIVFGTLSERALAGRKQYDVYLKPNFTPMEKDLTRLFNPDIIKLGTIQYQNKQLFYYAQAANFVPFKVGETADYVPPEIIGKTNRELWDQYGVAIGGIVAPDNAMATDSRINGLIGDPVTYLPRLNMVSDKYTKQLFGYQVVYTKPETGRIRYTLAAVNLREGWNLITRVIDSRIRTFFVFGDIIPPTFVVSPKTPLVINPLDLKMGFFLQGTVFDNSIGGKTFSRMFTNLDRMPVQQKADGTKYIILSFQIKDRAGNTTSVNLELVIDPNAPLQKHATPPAVRIKEPSVTLLALLGFKQLAIFRTVVPLTL